MSNDHDVRSIEVFRGDFTRECIFSVFRNMLPKKTTASSPILTIILRLLIGLGR